MRTYTTTCDICKRVIDPADIRSLTLSGIDKDVDSACLGTFLKIQADPTVWEKLREVAARSDVADVEVAAVVAEVVKAPVK